MRVWRFERLVAFSLAAIFAGSPFANCMTAPVQTNADMACCITEQHDCMPRNQAADCCDKTAPQSAQQFLTTSTVNLPAPHFVIVAMETSGVSATDPVARPLTPVASPPPLKSPIYLTVSTLRL